MSSSQTIIKLGSMNIIDSSFFILYMVYIVVFSFCFDNFTRPFFYAYSVEIFITRPPTFFSYLLCFQKIQVEYCVGR